MDIIDNILALKGIDRELFDQINNNYVVTKHASWADNLPKSNTVDVDLYVIYYLNLMCKDREFLINYRISHNIPVLCGLKISLWCSDKANVNQINVIMACDYYNKKILEDFTELKDALIKLPNYVIQKSHTNGDVKIDYPTMKIINDTLRKINGDVNTMWIHKQNYHRSIFFYRSTRQFNNIIIKYVTEEHNQRNYDELNTYLTDNDISDIFKMVVENLRVEIDMSDNKPMTVFKSTSEKCNIDGHNITDILNYCDQSDIDQIELCGFSYYDTNALIASHLIKFELEELKNALLVCGPQLCEILLNNSHIDRQLKQTFMCVSKYFNNLVTKANVLFDCNGRVGCKEGCGNRIMVLKGSDINYLPKCVVCEDNKQKIYMQGERINPGNWARCGPCKCLFWVPVDDNAYVGKNPKCEMCVKL